MYDLIKTTEEDHFDEYRMKKLSASGLVDDDPAAFAKKVCFSCHLSLCLIPYFPPITIELDDQNEARRRSTCKEVYRASQIRGSQIQKVGTKCMRLEMSLQPLFLITSFHY